MGMSRMNVKTKRGRVTSPTGLQTTGQISNKHGRRGSELVNGSSAML